MNKWIGDVLLWTFTVMIVGIVIGLALVVLYIAFGFDLWLPVSGTVR